MTYCPRYTTRMICEECKIDLALFQTLCIEWYSNTISRLPDDSFTTELFYFCTLYYKHRIVSYRIGKNNIVHIIFHPFFVEQYVFSTLFS